MSELTLLILRLAFLALLWVFVFIIVYTLRSDLFGQRAKRMPSSEAPQPASPFPAPSPVSAPTPPSTPAVTEHLATPAQAPATKLVITSGGKQGTEIPLTGEQLTIGRSNESGLVIRDDYTSTHHARLMLWNGEWMIQDLDSTNGTFLGGTRVSVPTRVPLNTPVKIGTTSFELRR